jgi:diguanylate cyclase (GGDEF)-like protein/PAS domain S-box-containing protein
MPSNIPAPEATQNYKLLYERSPVAYQSLDSDGNFIIVNPAWSKLLGYSSDEVIGKWFGDFLAPESKEKVLRNFPKFKAAGKICGIEFNMLCKDGSLITVSFDGCIGYDEQGNFTQTHCVLQDLTEKKKNAVIEESYGHIFENSLNEIFVFDAETFKFIKVNRGACKNMGYTHEELSELTPWDIKPEVNYESFMALIEPLRSGAKEIIQFESIHQRKNGSRYFAEVHLQLTAFLSKPAYIAIIMDVTQRKEIENSLSLVIEGAELGYWDWDYVTGKHQVNDRWLEMLGLSQDDLDNYIKDWEKRLHPDDKKRVKETINYSIEFKKPYTVEFRMRHKLGHWVWIHYDTDNKSALRLCGTHQDISVRKQSEEQIRKLSQAVEQSPSLVIITDTEGNIEYVNSKIQEITGYSVNEVVGKNTRIFSSGKTPVNVYKVLWNTIKSGEDWRGTLQNKKKNGDLYWSQESIAPIKDSNNQITHFIAIQEDITEVKKVSEQLNYQATHDPLTGLINRREVENRVNRIIGTTKNNNSEHVLCYLDLDQFKIINDTCTHIAGDELLKQFANILRSTFRRRDTVGRLGGDEFAVLLEHCSVQQAENHAQNLLTAISNFQFHWDNKSFRIGVSIGIVAITSNTEHMSALLSRADVACYSAKHAGRNCIHVYQESDEDLALGHKELQWISRINQALNENLFILYAQPIYLSDNSVNKSDHYEILLRLQDSNGDIIPPGAFLPAVERFNLTLQLDQWVINAVFDWIKKTALQNVEVPSLSINLSGQNLDNKQLLTFIKRQLENCSHQLTNKICFEITETAAINNLTDAKDFILELRKHGIKFSLDDFGSGLSSFDYLKNLPVDFLKIDGQFVKNIENDPIDLALVKSINEIGHIMGKKTIAEFVENEQVLKILADINVDYVQGYHLGKPQPLDMV